jgi:hypothetical protein
VHIMSFTVIMLWLFEAKLKLTFICLSSWIKEMIIKNCMCKAIYYYYYHYYYYKCKKGPYKTTLEYLCEYNIWTNTIERMFIKMWSNLVLFMSSCVGSKMCGKVNTLQDISHMLLNVC